MTPIPPMTLLEAIATEEGFYVAHSRPQRNNNPGDLEWRPWQARFGGSFGTDPRFAIFPNPDLGFQALKHLLGFPLYKGKTIAQFAAEFAPAGENDTNQYVLNICSFTGHPPDTIIDGLLG